MEEKWDMCSGPRAFVLQYNIIIDNFIVSYKKALSEDPKILAPAL